MCIHRLASNASKSEADKLNALGLPAGVLAGIAALIIALPVMVHQFKGVIEAALEQSHALIEAP